MYGKSQSLARRSRTLQTFGPEYTDSKWLICSLTIKSTGIKRASLIVKRYGLVTILGVFGFLFSAPTASAGPVSLGQAANYALFAGHYINTVSLSGSSGISGNVAVGSNGVINWASPATITGTVYEASGVSGSNSGVNPTGG